METQPSFPNGEQQIKKGNTGLIAFVAVAHLLCCGLPLLLASGLSLTFLLRSWPVLAIIGAGLGVAGFDWYFKRGCATCPRNEGRCTTGCRVDSTVSNSFKGE
ncbi:MAG: hypothetical protein NVS3B25_33030 [Hymenobacter sp.]